MSSVPDLERRVARLEAGATETAESAADVRELAAGADREVAELGIKVRVVSELIQALHTTQSDLARRVSTLEREVRAGFDEMRTGFAAMAIGFGVIGDRLDRAIGES